MGVTSCSSSVLTLAKPRGGSHDDSTTHFPARMPSMNASVRLCRRMRVRCSRPMLAPLRLLQPASMRTLMVYPIHMDDPLKPLQ